MNNPRSLKSGETFFTTMGAVAVAFRILTNTFIIWTATFLE